MDLDLAIWHAVIGWRDSLPAEPRHVLSAVVAAWSWLFRPLLVTLYAALLSVVLLARRAPRPLLPALEVALACGLTHVLKGLIERPRPPEEFRLVAEHTASLPSGHATAAVALAVVLTVRWGGRRALVVAAWVNAVVVCATRLYLGVHWATDLLAGAAVAVVCVGALRALAAREEAPHPGLPDRGRAVVHPELPIDVDEVGLHGREGDEQGAGDLPVARPRLEEGE